MSAFRKLVLTMGVAAAATTAFGQAANWPTTDVPTVVVAGSPAITRTDGGGGLTFPLPNVPDRSIVCDVNSNPLTVRVEGLSELLGDIELVCRGFLRANPRAFTGTFANANYAYNPPAPPTVEQVNISVTFNQPVTSRLVSDPLTEALLLVDNPTINSVGVTPNSLEQRPCAGTGAVCAGQVAHDGLATDTVAAGNRTITAGPLNDRLAGQTAETSTTNPYTVYQGVRQPNNNSQTIVFLGVPISNYDTRGNPRLLNAYNLIRAANGNTYAGQEVLVPWEKSFRIKNLRVAIAGGLAINAPVVAQISILNPPSRLQLNQSVATVGFVQQGLNFRLRNITNDDTGFQAFVACQTVNGGFADSVSSTTTGQVPHLIAQFREQYQVAFRVRGYTPLQAFAADQFDPRANYNTESGFYNKQFTGTNGLNLAGVADHGTRLRAVFNNLPANIRVLVSVAGGLGTTASAGAYAVVADAAGANQSSITVPLYPTTSVAPFNVIVGAPANSSFLQIAGGSAVQGLYQVPVTTGRGTFTWEVYAADPLVNENIAFWVVVAYRAANSPGLTTGSGATIQGTFAPVSTATSAAFGNPIPRFVETGSGLNAFTISPCLTNLLYPFVTSMAGFNTGIAISNTSLTAPAGGAELFSLNANSGISPQQGTCTINYFGTYTVAGVAGEPVPPETTGVIPAGKTFVMTLASGATGAYAGNVKGMANYQGYIIAQCNFRYAHGYAFISDIGAVQLAQGYIALVLDYPLTSSRTGISGESLGM